jgi:hypothetical protein
MLRLRARGMAIWQLKIRENALGAAKVKL